MGFELPCQTIDGITVFPEVLYETDDAVVSIMISGGTGDMLPAISYDINKINNNLSYLSCELDAKSLKALIPVKVGDFFVMTTLSKRNNELDVLCCSVYFVNKHGASGATGGIRVIDIR